MAKINIKQHDITDCGVACLASVSAHYRLEIPIARIRQFAGTDKKGTNLLGLIEAAQKLGFEAKGVRADFKSLSKIPKPAIAHIIVKKQLQHFVVIYNINKKYVHIMDPGIGKILKITHEEFKKKWTSVLLLLLPTANFKIGSEKISVLKRFWFLLKPHKIVLIQSLIGAITYTLLGLSTSIYIQKITDHVLVNGNLKLLNLLSIIMLTLLLIQIFIVIYKEIFIIKTGQQIDARLILGYYRHLLKLPQQFFDTMRVGEIISRINDAVKIRVFINSTILELTVNIFIVIFSFTLMFSYYWKLAMIIVSIIPIYLLIYWITNRLNKKTERRIMEDSADFESQLVESLNSIKTIKRFGLVDYASIKTETKFISLLNKSFSSSINNVFSSASSQFVSRVYIIILLWSGTYFVSQAEITFGELLSFYAIIGYFNGPIASLITANKTIQNALIAADRLFEIMDLELAENNSLIKLTQEKIDNITFKDVNFRYGTRVEVFNNFNLTIKKGNITAIVGESGSGKSTLMSLLQNLYPLQRGKISIGDIDLRYVEIESLRKLVGVVPQKIDLFAGNVIENIAVGEFQPDMERLLKICKEIGILNFIESLPNAFYTYLGENGSTLSGGQKQCIAIARALYKEPEILILDEATSSLDRTSENNIHLTIQKLREKGKTIIVIAHRLSTVVNADCIIVLERGNVIEQGSHYDLYKKQGYYYNLWAQHLPVQNKHNLK